MSESYTLIKELKRQLKLAGLHYADVAQHLNLSEGSYDVKRLNLLTGEMFSSGIIEVGDGILTLELDNINEEMALKIVKQ